MPWAVSVQLFAYGSLILSCFSFSLELDLVEKNPSLDTWACR